MQEIQESWVWYLGWEDPLEKEMADYSCSLAWRIPWTEKPGGLQSMGLQRAGHDLATEHTCGLNGIFSSYGPTAFVHFVIAMWHVAIHYLRWLFLWLHDTLVRKVSWLIPHSFLFEDLRRPSPLAHLPTHACPRLQWELGTWCGSSFLVEKTNILSLCPVSWLVVL